MNTASNTTAITDQRLAQPLTCRQPARAVVSLPSRATRSGRSGSHHPDAGVQPTAPATHSAHRRAASQTLTEHLTPERPDKRPAKSP